jgi:hypothetical protein
MANGETERCRWRCPRRRRPTHLLCRDCWYRLPEKLRRRITAARRGSDEAREAVTDALTIARTWWTTPEA